MNSRMNKNRFFLLWAFVCIAANFFFTFSKPHEGDLGFWQAWVRQLMNGGFGNFNGDYPPVYVLWLWVVGKFYSLAGLEVHKNFLLKFLCLVPVYFAHLGILQIVWRWICPRKMEALKKHLVLGFAALNPALLAGGPMWGQVDLFPLVFAMLSLSFAFSRKKMFLSFPFFVLAVLTKFQMIAFLPVLGALWIRRCKIAWKGIPLAFLVVAFAFVPFAVSGSLSSVLTNAYVKSTSMYPYTTFNAANLWMLLCGNVAPDNIPLFGLSPEGLGKFATVNVIGKLLFVLFSVWIFVRSLRVRNPRNAFKFATLMGIAFFAVLPEMHERYIVCAVPAALLWASRANLSVFPWTLLIAFFAAGNILMINGFRGDDLWIPLSLLLCASFVVLVLLEIFPKAKRFGICVLNKIPPKNFLPYAALLALTTLFACVQAVRMIPVSAKLEDGDILLYSLQRLSADQDYKSPQNGFSVEENPLTVHGKIYLDGIGAHAPSKLVYKLPPAADSLRFGYALDDEAPSGELRFRIRLDGKIVWSSGVVRGRNAPIFTAISLRGAETLTLELDSHGSDFSDHGDWLLPVVTTLK